MRPLVRRLADEGGEPGALRLAEHVCLSKTCEVISQIRMHLFPLPSVVTVLTTG